jgi:hypothetical protein
MNRFFQILIACLFFLFIHPALYSQTWETLSEIPEGLTYPVVTVLDGKIHVIGGGGAGGATDVHYVYDPATDSWSGLSPVPYLAQMPGGASAGGKIHYFGGGYPNSGTPLDDHYVYDPLTDTWTEAASLTAPRAIHYGISLNDTVYTLAGQGVTTLFEAYDPAGNSWYPRANLPDGYFMYSARCTANEKIYRFGGGTYMSPNNHAHVYDPISNEWSALPEFPLAVHGMEGAAVGDSIYLCGGYFDAIVTDQTWIFDMESETYTEGPDMPIERYYHSAVSIDDCIYLVGGYHPIFPDSVRVSLMRYCPYGFTGVEEQEEGNIWEDLDLLINRDHVNIGFPGSFHAAEVRISVFDILGRSLYSFSMSQASGNMHSFPISGFREGIYMLRLTTESDQYVRKFYVYD